VDINTSPQHDPYTTETTELLIRLSPTGEQLEQLITLEDMGDVTRSSY
jgi:hypothetical protein